MVCEVLELDEGINIVCRSELRLRVTSLLISWDSSHFACFVVVVSVGSRIEDVEGMKLAMRSWGEEGEGS